MARARRLTAAERAAAAAAAEREAAIQELVQLCDACYRVGRAIAGPEKERKELKSRVDALAAKLDVTALVGLDWLLKKSFGGRQEISAEKLRELGVPAETIAAATVRRRWGYYQVLSLADAEAGESKASGG